MDTFSTQTPIFPHISYHKKGTGQVLMLIHGFPEDGGLWDEIIDALSEHFTVLIPDLPGTGKSKLVTEEVNIGELAQAMYAILKEEEVEEAVIAGHSMGGYVALALADQFPDFVAGLSLVHSTATADSDKKKEARTKSIALIRKGGKEAFVKGMMPNLFSPQFKDNYPEAIEKQTTRAMDIDEGTMIAFNQAMMDRRDRTQVLTKATFPVQFIVGMDDSIIPNDIVMKQINLSATSFVSQYEGVGHMSMIEQPDSLVADLLAFTEYCFNRVN